MPSDNKPRTKGIFRKVYLPTHEEKRQQAIESLKISFLKTDMTPSECESMSSAIDELFENPVALTEFADSIEKLNETQAQEQNLLQQQKNLISEMDNETLSRVYNHPSMNAEKRDKLDKRYGADILKSRANNVEAMDIEGLLNIVPEDERENHAANLEEAAMQIEEDFRKIKKIAEDNVKEVKHVQRLVYFHEFVNENNESYARRNEAEVATRNYVYEYTQNYYNGNDQHEITSLTITGINDENNPSTRIFNNKEYDAIKNIKNLENGIIDKIINSKDPNIKKFTDTHKQIYDFIDAHYIDEITNLYLEEPKTSLLPTSSNRIKKDSRYTIENIALMLAKEDLISMLQHNFSDKDNEEVVVINGKTRKIDEIRKTMSASDIVNNFNITTATEDGKDILKINGIEVQNADKAINATKLVGLNNQFDDNYRDLIKNLPNESLLENLQKLGISPSKERVDENLIKLQEKYPFVKTLDDEQQRIIAKLDVSLDDLQDIIEDRIDTEEEILRGLTDSHTTVNDILVYYSYDESTMLKYKQQLQEQGVYPETLTEEQIQYVRNNYPYVDQYDGVKKDYLLKFVIANKNLQEKILKQEKNIENIKNDKQVAKQIVDSLKDSRRLLYKILDKSAKRVIFTQTTQEALKQNDRYKENINLKKSREIMLETHQRYKHIDEVFQFVTVNNEELKELRNAYDAYLQQDNTGLRSAGDIVKQVLREKIGTLTIDGRTLQYISDNVDVQKFTDSKKSVIDQQTQSILQTIISVLGPEYVQKEYNAQRNALINPQKPSAENMMQAVIESGLVDMGDIVEAFSNPDLEAGLRTLLETCGYKTTEIDSILNAKFLGDNKSLYRTFNSSQKEYIQINKRIKLLEELKEKAEKGEIPDKALIKTCKRNGIKIDRKTRKAFKNRESDVLTEQLTSQINMAQFEAKKISKVLYTNTEQEGLAVQARVNNDTYNKKSNNYTKRLDQIIDTAHKIANIGPNAYGLVKEFLLAASKGGLDKFATLYPQIEIKEIQGMNSKEIDQYKALGLSLKEIEKIAKIMKESGSGKISPKRVSKALAKLSSFISSQQQDIRENKAANEQKQRTEAKKLKKERKEKGPKKMEYRNRESFLARLFRIKSAAQEKVKEEQDRKREAAEERARQAEQRTNEATAENNNTNLEENGLNHEDDHNIE